MLLSIVSPVFNAAKILSNLVKQIDLNLAPLSIGYEIILVDDGSSDSSWQSICDLAMHNKKVRGLRLSRNFGQHIALEAGLGVALGENVAVMDCDLQDSPKYLVEMLKMLESGADFVLTKRNKRKQTFLRKMTANIFYSFVNWASDTKMDPDLGGYSMLKKKVATEYLRVNDYTKFYLPTLNWLGFNGATLVVESNSRFEGNSTYNWAKLLRLAIKVIVSHSDKLLKISIVIGFGFLIAAFGASAWIVSNVVLNDRSYLVGWPSLVVLVLASTGIILFSLGFQGLYISQIFEQVKNRQRFIIRNEVGL